MIVSESLSADLVLLRNFNTRLLKNSMPWMSKCLTDTHTLLRFIDKEICHKVLGFTGDVLPKVKVKVNISYLDTLKSFSVILTSEWWNLRKRERSQVRCNTQLTLRSLYITFCCLCNWCISFSTQSLILFLAIVRKVKKLYHIQYYTIIFQLRPCLGGSVTYLEPGPGPRPNRCLRQMSFSYSKNRMNEKEL